MIFRLLCFGFCYVVLSSFPSLCSSLVLFCNDDGRGDEGLAGTDPGPGMGHLMQRFAGGENLAGTW